MFTPPTSERSDVSQSAASGRKRILSNPLIDLILLALRPRNVSTDSATVRWIRQHPIIAVVGLAYALTWIGLIPLILDPSLVAHADFSHANDPAVLVYAFLGVLGCLWAAVIVAGAVGGAAGRYNLLRGYLKWKVGFGWYLVVLLSPAIIFAAAIALDLLLTGRLPVVPAFGLLPSALISGYIFFTARFMIGNWEEICWRATVLPRLQAKYTALISSLIVGVIQGLWHLPFVFVRGHYVQSIGLPAIVLQSMAMSIVATWIFNNTRGSLLMAALFHASFDALSQFQGSDVQLFYLSIGGWCLAAIIILIIFGTQHLSRKPDSETAYAIIPLEKEPLP